MQRESGSKLYLPVWCVASGPLVAEASRRSGLTTSTDSERLRTSPAPPAAVHFSATGRGRSSTAASVCKTGSRSGGRRQEKEGVVASDMLDRSSGRPQSSSQHNRLAAGRDMAP